MKSEMKNFIGCVLTGTAAEITPVSQVDNRKYKIGKVTKKLISLFSDLVDKKNSN